MAFFKKKWNSRISDYVISESLAVSLFRFWLASSSDEGIADNPLQLSVDRAEFISGPSLESLHRSRVDAKQKTFTFLFLFRHGDY